MKLNRTNNRLHHEFLPAALEITEGPASPFGRIVIWTIVLFVILAFGWSWFGKIDIVAVAPGKIIPEGKLKVIQPTSGGAIKSLNIKEGDVVKKDQLLAELDKTQSQISVDTLQKTLDTAKLERLVAIKVINNENVDDVINAVNISEDTKNDLREMARSRTNFANTRRQSINETLGAAKSRLESEKQVAATIQSNIALNNERLAALNEAEKTASDLQKITIQAEKNDINKNLADLTSSLESQKVRINEAQLNLTSNNTNLGIFNAENKSTSLASVIEQDKRIVEIEDALSKAKITLDQLSIKSPVDGKVLSISTTTLGGVVPAGQPFIIIVPSDETLIVESWLENKDVGFVHLGQKVAVKVDTYSFQRYGYLEGEVVSISPDAITDEKRPVPAYKILISLKSLEISKNSLIHPSPGMSVTSEITTGQRRIIEFFLDPFITTVDTSLKSR